MKAWVVAPILILVGVLVSACSKPAPINLINASGTPEARSSADFSVPGKILFVKDGIINLWNNGGVRKLTAPGSAFDDPVWSPDGRSIAAVIVGQNHSDLVILNADGKLEKQLTRNLSNVQVQDSKWARKPSWSPDGKALAYATDLNSFHFGLWTVGVGGTTPTHANYRPLGAGDVDSPSWSRDGKKLAFVAAWEETTQLYVLDSTSGVVKKLTNVKEGVYDSRWSPDGSRIVYAARVDGKHDLWSINADGTSESRLTSIGTARSPAWSPDSQYVAFLADQGEGFDLYVAKLSQKPGGGMMTSEAKRLTRGLNVDAPAGLSWTK